MLAIKDDRDIINVSYKFSKFMIAVYIQSLSSVVGLMQSYRLSATGKHCFLSSGLVVRSFRGSI